MTDMYSRILEGMLRQSPTSNAPAPRTTKPSRRVLLTALRPSLMASFICSTFTPYIRHRPPPLLGISVQYWDWLQGRLQIRWAPE